MGSDKMKALMYFAKLLVAAAVGYGVYAIWIDVRSETASITGLDAGMEAIISGIICTVMVFILLSKLNKGGD